MGTTRKPEGLGDPRGLLQGDEAPVRYDVSRGLARHQQLVLRAAPLPAWADELAPGTGGVLAPSSERRGLRIFAKRAWWLGGTLVVVGALWLWLGVRGGAGRSAPTGRVPTGLTGHPQQRSPVVESTPSGRADHAEAARVPTALPEQALAPRAEPSLSVEGQAVATPLPSGAPVATRLLPADVTPVVTPTSEQPSATPRATDTRRTDADDAPTTTPASTDQGAPKAALISETRSASGTPSTSARNKARVRAESPRDAEEMRQLAEAERLLKPEPVRALRIVREGHVAFRGGYFEQERRYIEVMALFALGRRGEAHAQATWFLRDYPGGPYRHRVETEMLRLPAR